MNASDGDDETVARTGRPRRDFVLDTLRADIIQGALEPGERLTEWDVANRLGVSRGPVREGLRELEREGLIRTYPYRGAVVMGTSDDELVGLLAPIRLSVERFAAVTACSGPIEKTLGTLDGIASEMQEAADANDSNRLRAVHRAFHQCIVESRGPGHAPQLWKSIYPRIEARVYRMRQEAKSSLGRGVLAHKVLLDVFRARDAAGLASELERHILDDLRRFMRADSGVPAG